MKGETTWDGWRIPETEIYETVPTTPRAAGDRSRGPGYMVWIHTIDT